MHVLSLYLDTSVIGGYYDAEFMANVRRESGFNAVDLLQGYPRVHIVAPTFLIHGHEEKEL
jgi:hypothetical protein